MSYRSDESRVERSGTSGAGFLDREDLVRRAFETAPYGVAFVAGSPERIGCLLAWNEWMARALAGGATPDTGVDVLDLVVVPDRAAVRQGLQEVADRRLPVYRTEGRPVSWEGTWIELVASLVPPVQDESPVLLIRAIDVSERHCAERAAAAHAATTRSLEQAVTEEGAVSALLPALAAAVGFSAGSYWVSTDDGEHLVCAAYWQAADVGTTGFEAATRRVRMPWGRGLPGRAGAEGRVVTSRDLAGDPDEPRRPAAAQDGLRAAVAFPVGTGGDVHGVLELATPESGLVDDALAELLGDIGRRVALELERKRISPARAPEDALLLVEDNAFIARLVGEMLEVSAMPLELVHVDSLAAAEAWLADHRPACALLDLTLPDAEGLEALIGVRKAGGNLPVVVLTGVEDEQVAARALAEGAQDYLSKRNVDMRGLARSIRYAIQRKGVEERMLERRLYHHVTGLPNRVLFVDRLRLAANRHGARVAVALLNVDRFRVVNDTFGHAAGDDLLKQLAGRLSAALRAHETVAALGGDHFGVLLEGVDAEAAVERTARLLSAAAPALRIEGRDLGLTMSAGVAVGRGPHQDADALIADAETALTRSKEAGGGRTEVFEEAVREQVRERMQLEGDLRAAIDQGQLRTFYQPIVALSDRRVVALEALVRWQHPARGLLPPGAFLPLAESSGLIVRLGGWVLLDACAQLAAWSGRSAEADSVAVNVNLSARQLAQPDVVAVVSDALQRTGLAPDRLTLEITETSLIEDLDATIETLCRVKDLGVGLALDDFGTGYSSLSQLERLPLDMLKLDRSFVAGMRGRPSPIAAAVAQVSDAMGLAAVAEGIESEEDAARVQELGYGLAQGFWFARPMSAADAEGLLERDGGGGAPVS